MCNWPIRFAVAATFVCGLWTSAVVAQYSVLAPTPLLQQQSFWDNRDWDWYAANIPLFECPDGDLQTTYYYRWELVTKHRTYGSPVSGYSFTEFIDRPYWSGAYGAISCPAGHQLYEIRWLRDPQYAADFARYWFRTPGAQPRNYSTWLADAVWAVHQVHPDRELVIDLLPDLIRNYAGWEDRHFVPEVGLFWQTGHDDGMEYNINSRQTQDIVRGAPGYRPTLNSYLWADALAIARVAEVAGQPGTAAEFQAKAEALKQNLQAKLWDPQRQFFFHLSQRDEEADGFRVQALTWTHQSGRHAGSQYGRELIGFVPWQFSLPDAGQGYERAWRKLVEADGFAAPFGPTTVERNDPMFLLKPTCCWWSGQSWPYATSQTLKALANLLQRYDQDAVRPGDYFALLQTYARTHRKDGKPYLAEACHPDTGSFAGHDSYNHSEHYFHSSFNDLVITGLVGLIPRDDDLLELKPLAPADWNYFALDGVPYRGRLLTVLWDRDGSRYQRGPGFRLLVDGGEVAFAEQLGPLQVRLPADVRSTSRGDVAVREKAAPRVNFAVNNDGTYYPRLAASFSHSHASLAKLNDGNFWYHRDPPNRCTCEGSPQACDWLSIDLGQARRIDELRLYFLDDGERVVPPRRYDVQYWNGSAWLAIPCQTRIPDNPLGHRANNIRFAPLQAEQVRVVFDHGAGGKTGLSEFEVWGPAESPWLELPPPAGNLAYRAADAEFPRARASFADRFGGAADKAIDGKTIFAPHPNNRWTSYESPNESDWLELDWGAPQEFSRVELAIYDDRGGVQPPRAIRIEYWNGTGWQEVQDAEYSPAQPTGGQWNEIRFRRARAGKLRAVFSHASPARSGVSEILVWND